MHIAHFFELVTNCTAFKLTHRHPALLTKTPSQPASRATRPGRDSESEPGDRGPAPHCLTDPHRRPGRWPGPCLTRPGFDPLRPSESRDQLGPGPAARAAVAGGVLVAATAAATPPHLPTTTTQNETWRCATVCVCGGGGGGAGGLRSAS